MITIVCCVDVSTIYRYAKSKLRHLDSVMPNRLNNGTKYQSCSEVILFKVLYTGLIVFNCVQIVPVFLSIDGNFGHCRKKASGTSTRPLLHGKTIFLDQD